MQEMPTLWNMRDCTRTISVLKWSLCSTDLRSCNDTRLPPSLRPFLRVSPPSLPSVPPLRPSPPSLSVPLSVPPSVFFFFCFCRFDSYSIFNPHNLFIFDLLASIRLSRHSTSSMSGVLSRSLIVGVPCLSPINYVPVLHPSTLHVSCLRHYSFNISFSSFHHSLQGCCSSFVRCQCYWLLLKVSIQPHLLTRILSRHCV